MYPLTEVEAELEQIVAAEYECPVCLCTTKPPIMECINGHVICFECWLRCSLCPTCRTGKTITRAHSLEKLHPLITFRCKFEGCLFMANASYTGEVHEKLCKYYPIKCPLAESYQCNWIGTMKSVKQHLLSLHSDNVYFSSTVTLKSRCFARSKKKNYTVIFIVDDQVFKFYWNYDATISPFVKFGMIRVGNGDPKLVYTYSIVFAKQLPINHTCRKFKIIKAEIKKSVSDCSILNRPDAQESLYYNHKHHYCDLMKFCYDNDLVYQIIIEFSHYAKQKTHKWLK